MNKPNVIDISHYQHVTDWQAIIDQGIKIVILKATQGASYVDPTTLPQLS